MCFDIGQAAPLRVMRWCPVLFSWDRTVFLRKGVLMFSRNVIWAVFASAMIADPVFAAFSDFTPLASSAGPIPIGDPLEATPIDAVQPPVYAKNHCGSRDSEHPGARFKLRGLGHDRGQRDWPRRRPVFVLRRSRPTSPACSVSTSRSELQHRARSQSLPTATQSFVAGDMSKWAPWGGYLTAEESWGTEQRSRPAI